MGTVNLDLNFDVCLDDPAHLEQLRELNETESEIAAAYDSMGTWQTHPDVAIFSHAKRASQKRREKKELYRSVLVRRVDREENPLDLSGLAIRPDDFL